MIEKIINLFFEKKRVKSVRRKIILTNNRTSLQKFEYIDKIKKTSLSEYFKTAKGLYNNTFNNANFSRSRTEFLKFADFYQR